ncbi:hypothetical protein BC332_10184 [Capsicum chinense]|nr:hypothetical protein BC332_10184 [Capsicum chinense]
MEGKKTAGRQKISLMKIEKYLDLCSTFSKSRSGLYKKASELVRENDVDLGIVLTSPTEAEKAYSFVHPTHNVVIDRFMNLPQEFDLGEHLVAKNSHDIMKFQAWLDVGEVMLKGQLREDSSLYSYSPPEDADI